MKVKIIKFVRNSANGNANHRPVFPKKKGTMIKQGIENIKPRSNVRNVAARAFSILCKYPINTIFIAMNTKAGEK